MQSFMQACQRAWESSGETALALDRSFVRDMINDPDDLAIVQGVAAFPREVIAEGVETQAHENLLLSMGCELAQGFGIARPMPAAEMPGWLAGTRMLSGRPEG
jgi:EAL domain-containing protein (putative c-di-GMP-specific phosphodiesterase class I)